MATTKHADGQESKAGNSAVGKAFAILRVLRRASTPLTLTSIAEEVGMAPSSAHSVLNQLLKQDAVRQDRDKRYQLGPSVFYIGSAFARNTRAYRSIWMELVTAANELAVTAALAVPWDRHHLVLNAHRAGDSDVAVPFGGRVPLDASSWGKVYYGWTDTPPPAKLVSYTAASITEPKAFAKVLEDSRQAGFATDVGEFFDGVGGVAAPITSDAGYEALASFLAPLDRVEEVGIEQLGRRIAAMTARASLALGAQNRVRFFGSE